MTKTVLRSNLSVDAVTLRQGAGHLYVERLLSGVGNSERSRNAGRRAEDRLECWHCGAVAIVTVGQERSLPRSAQQASPFIWERRVCLPQLLLSMYPASLRPAASGLDPRDAKVAGYQDTAPQLLCRTPP